MILSIQDEFADAVSVAGVAGTANIGNIIDQTLIRDAGNGRQVYLILSCDVAVITAGGAGTIAFRLVSDSSSTPSTTTCQEHFRTPAYTTNSTGEQLTAGAEFFCAAIPLDGLETWREFIGIQAIIATTTVSAGNISAHLTLDPTGYKTMPQGSSI